MRTSANRRDDADAASELVPFDRMGSEVRDGALRELAGACLRAGAPDGVLAQLAGKLCRAPDGALLVELAIPYGDGWPTSKQIGSLGAGGAAWALKLLSDTSQPVDRALFLTTFPRAVPLAEAVLLCSDPQKSPLAEMDRRRSEVARRDAESASRAAAQRAERRRAEEADSTWLARNNHRVSRWRELPEIWRLFALAADESGDPKLQALIARAIEMSASRDSHPRPPGFLWPLSG